MSESRAHEGDRPVDRDSEGVYFISVADFERRRVPEAPAPARGPAPRPPASRPKQSVEKQSGEEPTDEPSGEASSG